MSQSEKAPTEGGDAHDSRESPSASISVRVTAPDQNRFPDLDNLQSVVLKQGPRSRKEAKYSAIKDRHSGAVHHYALSIQTYRRKEEKWNYDKEHSISLSSEGEDEIQKLLDFLRAARGGSIANQADYVIVKAPENASDKDAMEAILNTMSGNGKAQVMAEILERTNRDEGFLDVLLDRAARNPQLFAEAAAALNLATYQAAVEELKRLVNATGKVRESAFQELLEENPWLFGSEYSELLGRRRLTRDELQDFVVRRTTGSGLIRGDVDWKGASAPLLLCSSGANAPFQSITDAGALVTSR